MDLTKVDWEITPLKDPLFQGSIPDNLELNDIVVTYADGIHEKVVSYKSIKYFPLIYDYLYENEHKIPITLTICPVLLNPVVYSGHCVFTGETYLSGSVLSVDGVKFSQFTGESLDKSNKTIRRWSGSIDTLSNIIKHNLDPMFLKTPSSLCLSPTNWIDISNAQNKLIYGVRYRSNKNKNHDFNSSLIVPKKNTFDMKQNGFLTYLHTFSNKLKQREGFIQISYYSIWEKVYPESKLINL
jgi:hypothetical protein